MEYLSKELLLLAPLLCRQAAAEIAFGCCAEARCVLETVRCCASAFMSMALSPPPVSVLFAKREALPTGIQLRNHNVGRSGGGGGGSTAGISRGELTRRYYSVDVHGRTHVGCETYQNETYG